MADQQGTIRDLAVYDDATDTTSIATHIVYDAYGNVTSTTHLNSTAVDCLFKYTGRALSTYTSLQSNWERWYDPTVGRWISEDPIGFNGLQTNTSAYVANSPTNATDPTGLLDINDPNTSITFVDGYLVVGEYDIGVQPGTMEMFGAFYGDYIEGTPSAHGAICGVWGQPWNASWGKLNTTYNGFGTTVGTDYYGVCNTIPKKGKTANAGSYSVYVYLDPGIYEILWFWEGTIETSVSSGSIVVWDKILGKQIACLVGLPGEKVHEGGTVTSEIAVSDHCKVRVATYCPTLRNGPTTVSGQIKILRIKKLD